MLFFGRARIRTQIGEFVAERSTNELLYELMMKEVRCMHLAIQIHHKLQYFLVSYIFLVFIFITPASNTYIRVEWFYFQLSALTKTLARINFDRTQFRSSVVQKYLTLKKYPYFFIIMYRREGQANYFLLKKNVVGSSSFHLSFV